VTSRTPVELLGAPDTPWVFVHAHPDDESLLTAGTMRRVSEAGRRTVVVFATDGAAGLADSPSGPQLAARREEEALASAALLGCDRVEFLGYADSGLDGHVPGGFCGVPVAQAAERLAALLIEERAGVVTSYDASGGYGHPDHVQVHRVVAAAARQAATPLLLEATVDRDQLLRVLRLVNAVGLLPAGVAMDRFSTSFVPGADITHRVDVRRHARVKRASMMAHASQAGGGDGLRTLRLLQRLPMPLFRRICGTEWFVQRDV
jgi:LmbE family N-acetylglucosaminyl deacetylase